MMLDDSKKILIAKKPTTRRESMLNIAPDISNILPIANEGNEAAIGHAKGYAEYIGVPMTGLLILGKPLV